jgi:TolA-binding protein
MKSLKILSSMILGIIVASTIMLAQESSFDRDVRPWHKKATLTCGMMRDMKTFDPAKMLSNLNELEKELQPLAAKYATAPPPEYARDPLWSTYFEDLADNITIVRERVERKEYRLAQKYCGQFCMTFGKMHKTNGRVTLTDMLFSLRMEVKNAMDMVNAGNIQGAKSHVSTLAKLHENIEQQIRQSNTTALAELQKPLMDAYDQWITAVNAGDSRNAESSFTTFMSEFPKLYGATF